MSSANVSKPLRENNSTNVSWFSWFNLFPVRRIQGSILAWYRAVELRSKPLASAPGENHAAESHRWQVPPMPQHATTCHNNTELQARTPNTKSNFLEFLGCWRSVLSYSPARDKVPSRRSSFLKRLHPVKRRKKSAAAAMTTTNIKHNTRVFSLTILLEEYLSLITLN